MESKAEERKGAKGAEREQKARTTAEWVTLGASTLIVLALAGLVVFQTITQGTKPPEIEVVPLLEEVRQVGDKHYLSVAVSNKGEIAVEAIEVEIELAVEGEEPETVGFTVPFLAGLETDTQTVILSKDPRSGDISHTVSFHEP